MNIIPLILQITQTASPVWQTVLFWGAIATAVVSIYKAYKILIKWIKTQINDMINAQLIQQNNIISNKIDKILDQFKNSDSSVLKSMKETVERVESRQQALLDARDNEKGIFELEADGKMRFVNNRFCYLLGRTKDDLMGYGWFNFISPPMRSRIMDEFQECIDQQREFNAEFAMQTSSRFKTINVIMRTTKMIERDTNRIIGYLGNVEEKI